MMIWIAFYVLAAVWGIVYGFYIWKDSSLIEDVLRENFAMVMCLLCIIGAEVTFTNYKTPAPLMTDAEYAEILEELEQCRR